MISFQITLCFVPLIYTQKNRYLIILKREDFLYTHILVIYIYTPSTITPTIYIYNKIIEQLLFSSFIKNDRMIRQHCLN